MAKVSVITPSIRPQFLDMAQRCLEKQTFQDFEWLVEIGLRNRGYGLPRDWNKLLKRTTGDLIVIYQDCITIPEDALEKVVALDHAKTAYTYPVGKHHDDNVYWDWRKHIVKLRDTDLVSPDRWEIDLASAPRSLFFDVGGFDEDFCNGWSWENVEIAHRAAAAGYQFRVSQVTEGVALDHDAIIENPFRNKMENNDKRAIETWQRAQKGEYKLNYL